MVRGAAGPASCIDMVSGRPCDLTKHCDAGARDREELAELLALRSSTDTGAVGVSVDTPVWPAPWA